MKFNLFFFLFLSFSFLLKGQVGIGTTSPDPGTVLHLVSANKGLLIPRVNLLGTTDNSTVPVLAADEGIIVYNLNDSGIAPDNVVKDTFYIWADNLWQAISEISDIQTDISDNNTTQQMFSGNWRVNYPLGTNNNYSAWTRANYSTEYYDKDNVHSSGTFTIPETGLYSFIGAMQIPAERQTMGVRIMDVTNNIELGTSYFNSTNNGGASFVRVVFNSCPLHWMGLLTAGTKIEIQFRRRGYPAVGNGTLTGHILMNRHL